MSQMQELTELKNLVIQSLEANGSLAKIRAQIRASVFNVVDQQEGQPKKPSPFFWENNKAQQIYDIQGGREMLELIKEFLLHYDMHYSSSIFSRQDESNLREDINREELAKKLNLDSNDNSKPLLHQLVFQNQKLKPQLEKVEQKDQRQEELQRQEQQRQEQQKIEQQKQEQQRQDQQRQEQMRIEKERQEKEKQIEQQREQLRLEQLRVEKEKEQQRIQEQKRQEQILKEKEKQELEKKRQEDERKKQEEQIRLEQERQKQKQKEQEIKQQKELEKQKAEQERVQQEQAKKQELEKQLRLQEIEKLRQPIPSKKGQAQKQALPPPPPPPPPPPEDEYEDENFEDGEVEEDQHMYDDVYTIVKCLNYKQMGESGIHKQDGVFNSSEEFMQASQSQGFDMTVDSMALEEFDYYEDVEDV